MLLRVLALAALLIAAPAAAAPKAPARLQLVDLTNDFGRVWAATETLSDGDRPAAFSARFGPILPGFYDYRREGAGPEDRFNARLLRALQAYPERRTRIEQVSARFDAMFQPALTAFERRFGPMTGYPPVYLVNSLGEFDGGTRELGGRPVLFFGADVIARLHMAHDIQPFFHHELFHLYHQRHFTSCEAVWCGIWTEGLAVYVAKSLNAKATDEELLLTQPEPLRPAVDAHRDLAVCTVVAHLDSQDDKVMGALFSDGRLSPELPPRFGYYVGYLAAGEMARTRSPKQLAAMTPAQVRPQLEAALRRLASCPPARPA
jgi:hypothetical protein